VAAFEKYFYTKTGNKWENRQNFVNKPNKYLYVELENDEDVAQAQAAAQGAIVKATVPKAVYTPSKLDAATQSLVSLLFDEDMFRSAMVHMNLDARKLPLGALSKRQLDKGDAALEALEAAIKVNMLSLQARRCLLLIC